mgnify:CR=1 FL=1
MAQILFLRQYRHCLKKKNLERFARDHFECCIYDEAHHTSADSYKKDYGLFLLHKFTLGMTATPDKKKMII